MADDSNARYRTNDPYRRGPAQTAPASDPLAELARLIGQNDPFAEFGRDTRPPPRDNAARHYPGEPAPHYGDAPEPYGGEAVPRYQRDYPPPYANEPAPEEWPQAAAPAHPAAPLPADPLALPLPKILQRPEPEPAQRYADAHHPEPGPEDYPADHPGFAPMVHPSAADRHQPAPQALYPHDPDAGSMPPPHGDEFYDDAPRGGRRRGLMTVTAVLALAVIGTAGAFGYRSLFGSGGAASPPPVIRASNAPSKVAPPPASTDQAASRFSFDRFADRGKDEQVVARQEKPVDPRDLARSSAARAPVPSGPAAGSTPPARPSANAAAPDAKRNPPSALGEPRRVRTVPIRPDQPDTAARSQAIAAMPPAPARQTQVAAAPAADPPPRMDSRTAPPPQRSAVAARAASSRTASRAPSRPVAPPPPPANAPLSLSPGANYAPPPMPAQASAPPTPPPVSRAPTRLASAPTASAGGRYLVQVSSQRSEADAEASFRNIQTRYSGVLGGQPHVVRRANLGSRGTYYRAMVGPFATRDQAIQLCSSLKAAGGDCVVQTN